MYQQGNYLYIAHNVSDSLSVVDISTPNSPSLIAQASGVYNAQDVIVSGNFAYVGTTGTLNAGVHKVDISNPAAPYLVETINGSFMNSLNAVDYTGNHIYAVGESRALVVIDTQSGTVINQDENGNILASSYAWTASDAQGLRLADTCTDWGSGGGGGETTAGSGAVVGEISGNYSWTNATNYKCGSSLRLYCFQQ